MSKFHRHRPGLTLLEIVFVIVVLGIVTSIGAGVIAQSYESYIVGRAQYRANIKTELALNQIANRLRYSIPSTVGFRVSKISSFSPITSATTGVEKVLQWVAYDGDGYNAIESAANTKPGWNGFCDVDSYIPGSTTLPTPGSNIGIVNNIVSHLGGNIGDAALFFPDGNATSYGISGGADENITLDVAIPPGGRIYERYKLAWTSYALEVDGNNDLILHYALPPVPGTTINGKSSVLLHNVTNFRFLGSEGAMRVKICKREQIGGNSTSFVHACKEKVIF